ncbi:hypothetical protein FRB94_014712 [Tulasnella sp. JGI-2019a]|nr:hypothetical protein FRB94_014712 [Tulasnella sp. JGI-2019a]KAG9012800.1 hypothetical protein FRB93_001354 [Tulasnella sp. JGI-2019a]
MVFLNRWLLSSLFGVACYGVPSQAAWTYPDNGWATMTHYDLPKDYIAACGCTAQSTHYPTAALSQLAYGSTAAYGPSCGRCFNLTLISTIYADPPFYPNPTKSIVVKITDECPAAAGSGLCAATAGKPNSVGAYLNFDLAQPSTAIPADWFPSNASLYGYTDFGVWNISYASLSCQYWSGWQDEAALGSVSNVYGDSVCCPADVRNASMTCPSFSDQNGTTPPNTTSTGGAAKVSAAMGVTERIFMAWAMVMGAMVLI